MKVADFFYLRKLTGSFPLQGQDDAVAIVEDDAESSDSDDAEEPEEVILVDNEPEYSYDTGVLLFRTGDRISSVDKHSLEGSAILRSVYIGDWVYSLDSDGNVQSFNPAF